MLKLFKRRERTTTVAVDRGALEIRDLLEHPQLRAAMGLAPLPGTAAATAAVTSAPGEAAAATATFKAPARAHRRRRVLPPTVASRSAARPLTRSAA